MDKIQIDINDVFNYYLDELSKKDKKIIMLISENKALAKKKQEKENKNKPTK